MVGDFSTRMLNSVLLNSWLAAQEHYRQGNKGIACLNTQTYC